MDNDEVQENNQFEELIQGLIDRGFGCCNNFVLPAVIDGLRQNIHNLSSLDKLEISSIGNSGQRHQEENVRGDKIKWIDAQSVNLFELIYLKKVASFIHHLNKTCFTSIKSSESHYSNYAKERFYKRHLDQFKDEKGRKFSLILYLNDNWKKEDGGILSLYPKLEPQKDIFPLGGRMVFFKSNEMEHEVHPSNTRERNSIAGWLKN